MSDPIVMNRPAGTPGTFIDDKTRLEPIVKPKIFERIRVRYEREVSALENGQSTDNHTEFVNNVDFTDHTNVSG